ncbi:unnamed protein product [Lactuca saligna]|uniref:ADP,ATP carrier protein n=1 Tax=Lactuca saligna TaxID=75948 RepID=A0AA35ZRB5_LACSI|nr:unnamed protein product [Lactuca saligna]
MNGETLKTLHLKNLATITDHGMEPPIPILLESTYQLNALMLLMLSRNGEVGYVNQANNMYLFLGVGLGSLLSDAHYFRWNVASCFLMTRLQAQAAGVAYSHPMTNLTSRMAVFGPNMMFTDLRCSPSCTRAGVHGTVSICPPDCFEYKGTLDVFYKVIRQEGFGRLWRGTNAGLALAILTVGIYLPCYDIFRNWFEEFAAENAPSMTPYAPLLLLSFVPTRGRHSCGLVACSRSTFKIVDGPASSAVGNPDEIAKIFPSLFGQPSAILVPGESNESGSALKIGVVLSGGQAPRGHNIEGLTSKQQQYWCQVNLTRLMKANSSRVRSGKESSSRKR